MVLLFVCRFAKEKIQGDLLLQNIEALANTENKDMRCYGIGSLDCAVKQTKVLMIIYK